MPRFSRHPSRSAASALITARSSLIGASAAPARRPQLRLPGPDRQVSALAFTHLADRGIGGTGIGGTDSGGTDSGGTGIVGVITGFASVCVNGLEIAYDSAASVDLNGIVGTAAALRAGQVVVIQADGPPGALHARTMSLRQEVSGRIEAIELGSGLLTIAGQQVAIPAGTWGANRFGLGDWVAVSGLPRADGVIVASRLDDAPADVFSARGRVARDGAATVLGRLSLSGPAFGTLRDGQFVTVSGTYHDGQPQAAAVEPDKLPADPAGYFGLAVDTMVMQAFVRPVAGAVWLNGTKLAAASTLKGSTGADGIAVVSLKRGPDGRFSAITLNPDDFRVHATAAAPSQDAANSKAAGQASALTQAATHHIALTPSSRIEATGAGAVTNFQPAAASAYLAHTSNPPVAALPAMPTVAMSLPSVVAQPSPVALPVVPLANVLPASSVSATLGTATSAISSGITTLGRSANTLSSGLSLGAQPLTQPSQPETGAPAALPVAPQGGAPPVDSATSQLISQNNAGSVLSSRGVHARSITGVSTKSNVSLITTTTSGATMPNTTTSGTTTSGTTTSGTTTPGGTTRTVTSGGAISAAHPTVLPSTPKPPVDTVFHRSTAIGQVRTGGH